MQDLDDDAIGVLASSPHAQRLRWLDITANSITARGLEALCASPNLERLLYVNCLGNRFEDPTDVAGTEGEAIIQTDATEAGRELEQRFGRIAWLHSPDYFDFAWPPGRQAIEPG